MKNRLSFILFLMTLILSWDYSNAQYATIAWKKNKRKIDTVLIYNPYSGIHYVDAIPKFVKPIAVPDTVRRIPSDDIISQDSALNIAAHDCEKFDKNIYKYIYEPSFNPKVGFGIYSYMKQNLRYPNTVKNKNIHGVVVVEFKLCSQQTDNNGKMELEAKVLNPIVRKSLEPSMDGEAIRLVANMEGWLIRKEDCRYLYRILIKF